MHDRRKNVKKVAIMVIALALFIAGIAMADAGPGTTRQMSFIGEDDAGITSIDSLSERGDGPVFSSRIETVSPFMARVVNARIETNSGFVAGSATTPSSLNNYLRLDEPGSIPSVGKVSAYMEGLSREASGTSNLVETIEFSQITTVDGEIGLFEMNMHWESGGRRV